MIGTVTGNWITQFMRRFFRHRFHGWSNYLFGRNVSFRKVSFFWLFIFITGKKIRKKVWFLAKALILKRKSKYLRTTRGLGIIKWSDKSRLRFWTRPKFKKRSRSKMACSEATIFRFSRRDLKYWKERFIPFHIWFEFIGFFVEILS